jgi:hypothetical protein
VIGQILAFAVILPLAGYLLVRAFGLKLPGAANKEIA